MVAPRPERRGVTATLPLTLVLTLSMGSLGCGSDASPPEIPEGCNTYGWAPGVADLSSFPTSDFLVADESRPTGYQMSLPEGADLTPFGPLAPLFDEHIVDLDGVGVQGEMWLGFSGTFDPAMLQVADGEAHPEDSIGIVVLPEDGPPVLVPTQARTSDTFLYVRPLTPLPEATRVAYFATRGLSAAAGGCLEPLEPMWQLLRRPDDDRRDAIEALTELGVVEGWEDLVALHVVTTQSITRESVAIAAHIETLSPALTDTVCTDEGTYRRCSAMLMVEDYRAENGAVDIDVNDVSPQKSWEVPVSIWLPPASMAGPYPTIVFGHGLTDTRNSAAMFAEDYAEDGWATVAIDALVHGDHPSTEGVMLAGIQGTFRFFALTLSNPPVLDARRLRDHWRQSTYDKLQLTRMLTSDGDLDGDGDNDVDTTRLVYFGISLGGIMSTELVAMSDAYSAVVNMEGGGTLSRIVYDDDSSFSPLVTFVLRRQTADSIAQSFAALQMVLDRGDGSAYGRHVLLDRLRPSSAVPDYLFGVTLDDNTVTNASNYSLARALGIPHVGDQVRPVVGLTWSSDAPPLMGNGEAGATAGLLQYDVIDDGGEVVVATHTNMPTSDLARSSIGTFLESHFADGTATLIDPYAEAGLAHGLPAAP